jgi:hypothetical protein
MSFRITGLSPEPFRHLFGLSDDALRAHGAIRYTADSKPGFPDRIELRDAEPGETLLLLNHVHQPADNPYRASHAIFVLEGAAAAFDAVDTVPEVMRVRLMNLRAFDANDLMIGADVVDGRELEASIEVLLANPETAYIHAHYAMRGCYSARITRA